MTPNVVRRGKGAHLVLAIHCTLAHSGAWKGLTAALQDEAEVTAYDLPSHGRSPKWDGQSDLHQLSTEWGKDLLERPMHVVGHSFGATVALRLAMDIPDRVQSLTIIEPPFYAAAVAAGLNPSEVPESGDFEALLKAQDWSRAAPLFNDMWGDGTPWQDVPEKMQAYMIRCMPIVAASSPFMVQDKAGLLDEGLMESIRCPVRLIQGANTLPIVDAIMAALAVRMPHAERITVPDAGHMVPISHPGAVAQVLRGLLNTGALVSG